MILCTACSDNLLRAAGIAGGSEYVKKANVIPRGASDRGNPHPKTLAFLMIFVKTGKFQEKGLPRQRAHWLATKVLTV